MIIYACGISCGVIALIAQLFILLNDDASDIVYVKSNFDIFCVVACLIRSTVKAFYYEYPLGLFSGKFRNMTILENHIEIEPTVASNSNAEECPECVHIIEHWHVLTIPTSDSSQQMHSCIGLVFEAIDQNCDLIMSVDLLMDADTFFQFPMERAKSHFAVYAEEDCPLFASEFCILLGLRENALYDVIPFSPIVHKTHCIRIIQRTWRKIYKAKIARLRRLGTLASQRRFELCGKYDAL